MPGEKPLRAKERTNNKLNPHKASTPGFEPGPHWWEASALTTAPSPAAPPALGPIVHVQGLVGLGNLIIIAAGRGKPCKYIHVVHNSALSR